MDAEQLAHDLGLAEENNQLLEAENAALREQLQQANVAVAAGTSIIEDLKVQLEAAKEAIAAEIKMRNVWQCAYEEGREDLAAAQNACLEYDRKLHEAHLALDAAQKDAERYRWLREYGCWYGNEKYMKAGNALDNIIDAAIEKEKTE